MHRLFKRPFVPIVLLVLVAGFGGLRWRARTGVTGFFKTALVRRGDLDATSSATGTTEPVEAAAVAQARAATLQAKAGLDKARRNLDFCTIRSPVKGVIIDRRVNIGQTVVASVSEPDYDEPAFDRGADFARDRWSWNHEHHAG